MSHSAMMPLRRHVTHSLPIFLFTLHLILVVLILDIACSWKPIVENIESRFDNYLEQENRVNRNKLQDNRVHACIYFVQPTGHR